PLHIWGWEGFNRIVYSYGKLLNLDPETLNQTRYDVARVQLAVTDWSMLDEEIEIKVDDQIFIIRMVEERSGGSNMGVRRWEGAHIGGGNSEEGSIPFHGGKNSAVGVEDGWSENLSDGEVSVHGGAGTAGGDCADPVGNDQDLCKKVGGSVEFEEREESTEKLMGTCGENRESAESAAADGENIAALVIDLVDGVSEELEVPPTMEALEDVGSHDDVVEMQGVDYGKGTAGEENVAELNIICVGLDQEDSIGPIQQNDKGKEVVVWQ
ncbi:hypothetical protein A2U01_0030898, partial [Trifolium medium]|nr:hypothetical protein [Trifolium medium]